MYGSVMSLTSCLNLVLLTPDSLSGTSSNNRKAEIMNVVALTMAEILQNILQTGMVHDNGVLHDDAYWLAAIEWYSNHVFTRCIHFFQMLHACVRPVIYLGRAFKSSGISQSISCMYLKNKRYRILNH